MKKTLLLSTHPSLKSTSVANKMIINGLMLKNKNIKFRDISVHQYDIKSIQKEWENCDYVIIQSPVWWFSMPSGAKSYFDQLLSYGWAYGSKNAIENKKILISLTTATRNIPQNSKLIKFEDYFLPFINTFKYCKANPRIKVLYDVENPNIKEIIEKYTDEILSDLE